MADHQRIHPAPDLEASLTPPSPPQPASAPLISRNSKRSDDDVLPTHNQYPPPPTRTLPSTYYPPPPRPSKSRRSCCCRAFCCIISLILFLIIAIGATIGILYLVFHPKIPSYSIDSLRITQFTPNSNNSLTATFAVNVTAHNPNKHIGIYYLDGSQISAYHNEALLCEGALPEFYQGHRNTTVMNVPLTGTVNDATGMLATVQQEQSQGGSIPLVLDAKVPIKIKLGKLKLMKMRFKVKCELKINNLAANSNIRISSSSCKIRLRRIF